jgi:hypothetical protein
MSDQQKDSNSKSTGKGRPTPSRKEREAANLRPIVGNKSKESIAQARQRQRESRARDRAAMLAGDEKFLLPRDRGPQRKIAREVIDNRYTIIEGLMPLMVVFLLLSSINSKAGQEIVTLVMIIALVVVGIESFFLFRIIKKLIREKVGSETTIQRGTWFYIISRGMQPRPLRIPKPAPRSSKKKK